MKAFSVSHSASVMNRTKGEHESGKGDTSRISSQIFNVHSVILC